MRYRQSSRRSCNSLAANVFNVYDFPPIGTSFDRAICKTTGLSICFQLPYTMSVDISNPSALSSSLNISQSGNIPVGGLQTWALSLHCGPYDAEVDLSLRINVSQSKKNITRLEFKRKKICLKDKSYIEPEEVTVSASGSTSGGQVFYVAISCASALIAAIFVVVIVYYVRDKKARRNRDPLQ